MKTASIPPDEERRLDALRRYEILDTASERSFDELTELAAAICSAPISLVSLVDEGRQWFKSRVGVEASETPRDWAFCAHAILQENLLVVQDATQDERFHDNPLVTSDPKIRFYAGAPLVVDQGFRVGTLCVIDRTPRELRPDQAKALRILGNAVVAQMEIRRQVKEIKALSSLLPMCAWCRRVRETDGSWGSLEDYVVRREPVTHGICPECQKRELG